MTSDAWKYSETEDGIIYNLQIRDVPWNFRKALSEAMRDWKVWGHGWNIKTGGQILIYSKTFKDEEDWTKWAIAFPLEVKEKRYWGSKVTTIIHKKAGK